VSWAAHDLEPYAIQKHTRIKLAFVPLLIGSYSPDMMSKWFVYGIHIGGWELKAHNPAEFHRGWPGFGFTHSLIYGVAVGLIIWKLFGSKLWGVSFVVGQAAHALTDALKAGKLGGAGIDVLEREPPSRGERAAHGVGVVGLAMRVRAHLVDHLLPVLALHRGHAGRECQQHRHQAERVDDHEQRRERVQSDVDHGRWRAPLLAIIADGAGRHGGSVGFLPQELAMVNVKNQYRRLISLQRRQKLHRMRRRGRA